MPTPNMQLKTPTSPTDMRVGLDRHLYASTAAAAANFFARLLAALSSNSVLVMNDLLRNAAEVIGQTISLLVARKIVRGRNFAYNFGIGKLENIASIIIGGVLMFAAIIIAITAWERLWHPRPLTGLPTALAVSLVIIAINTYFFLHFRALAARQASPIIHAQLTLYRNKVYINGTVLVALLCLACCGHNTAVFYLDPILAMLLCVLLTRSAFGVFAQSLAQMLDREVEETAQLIVTRELAAFIDHYTQFHGMRTRRSGSHAFIELHLEFDGSKTMAEVQRSIETLTAAIVASVADCEVAVVPATQPLHERTAAVEAVH